MNPKIVTFGPVKVAGYLHKTSHSNNTLPAFWGEVSADGRHSKLHSQDFVKAHRDYGVCFNATGDEFDYLLGLEIKDGAKVPEEFHQYEIKQGEYAVLSAPPAPPDGNMAPSIQKLWGDLYNWLGETTEYAHAGGGAGGADFELYNCDCTDSVECESCKAGVMVVDVYVAVTKK